MAIDEKLYAELLERRKNIYDLRQSGRTLSEIGVIYGISKERVRQIYVKECRKKRAFEQNQFRLCICPPNPMLKECCTFQQMWGKSAVASRAYNALRRAGIKTNEELVLRYEKDKCLGIRGVGTVASEYIGEYIKTIKQEHGHDGK